MKTKSKKHTTEEIAVFCEDGSYSSGAFAIIDVSRFTSDDWETIAEQTDRDRLDVALAIAKKRNTKK